MSPVRRLVSCGEHASVGAPKPGGNVDTALQVVANGGSNAHAAKLICACFSVAS
jgi:hypothetical protein